MIGGKESSEGERQDDISRQSTERRRGDDSRPPASGSPGPRRVGPHEVVEVVEQRLERVHSTTLTFEPAPPQRLALLRGSRPGEAPVFRAVDAMRKRREELVADAGGVLDTF